MSKLDSVEKVEVSYHAFKHGFMPNYLLWREHGEVETTVESDGDQDVDRMDDMVDDIRNEYPELRNNQALPEDVKEFYKLLEASEAKVHEGSLHSERERQKWT
jgi:enoyl reductase-like protein